MPGSCLESEISPGSCLSRRDPRPPDCFREVTIDLQGARTSDLPTHLPAPSLNNVRSGVFLSPKIHPPTVHRPVVRL